MRGFIAREFSFFRGVRNSELEGLRKHELMRSKLESS